MAILPSGLETVDYGTQGWNAIVTTNFQLLDSKLVSVMTAFKIFGGGTVNNNNATATNPAAQTSQTLNDNTTGTVTNVVQNVGGAFNQNTLNNNFAALTDEINKLQADVAESRTREAEYKTAIASLTTTVNALLTELRKTTGNGVLGG